jgi:hypothetical protein
VCPGARGIIGTVKRRSLLAQVLAGVAVAIVMTVAAAGVYVAYENGTAAIRDGQAVHALQVGLAALGAAVVAVLALTAYGHWLAVTDPPATSRSRRVPSVLELVAAGVVVGVLLVAAVPVLVGAWNRASAAYESRDLAWTVGWGLVGVAYVWFGIFCLEHYARWLRLRTRVTRGTE